MNPARPSSPAVKFYDPNLPQKCRRVGWFLFHMKCAVSSSSRWGRAIIGRGEARGATRPPAGAGIGEERPSRGSWGAIWWIRRLSWDGGRGHNGVRCPGRRDNIVRNILLWIKLVRGNHILRCWFLESSMNDHDQSRHVVLPRTFQRAMPLRQKVFTLVFWPPSLHIKRCSQKLNSLQVSF